MPLGLASPEPQAGGPGSLPRRRRPLGRGPFLALAAVAILAAGALASGREPDREICHVLPAVVAVAASRFGTRAGLSALGGALAALAFDVARRGMAGSGGETDLFDLVSVAATSAVVLGCVSLRWLKPASPAQAPFVPEAERDALRLALEEANHRIRNDLASLQSTVLILSAGLDGAEGRNALACLSGRIRLLGCIYQRLGPRTAEEPDVGMRAFLEEFCDELRDAHLGLRPVTLHLHAADVSLPPRRAVLVGLLVNEGITNALKHAFPDGREGCIRVGLAEDAIEPGILVLSVDDDGIGLPPPHLRRRGTGSRILDALARQLDGSVALYGASGMTSLRVRFPT